MNVLFSRLLPLRSVSSALRTQHPSYTQAVRHAGYGVHGGSRLSEDPFVKTNSVDRYVESLKLTRPPYFKWRKRYTTKEDQVRLVVHIVLYFWAPVLFCLLNNTINSSWSMDEIYYFEYFWPQY